MVGMRSFLSVAIQFWACGESRVLL